LPNSPKPYQETDMSRYENLASRAAFGAAAVAMTALTLAIAVVMPATLASGSQAARTLAAAKIDAPVGTANAADPMRLDVLGTRAPQAAFERVRREPANPAGQG
jgi:hypothetical protein